MKIIIDYNPFIVNTFITINGKEISQDNILYSIKKYTLQCWLSQNGSWIGLFEILKKISRGEKIELIFKGRTVDYMDLKEALNSKILNKNFIETQHIISYERNTSIELLKKSLYELKENFNIEYDIRNLHKGFLECIKVITKDNMHSSIDYLLDNSNIYTFLIEDIEDDYYIDLIVQLLQGNNFYHAIENTNFIIKNSGNLPIEEIQEILENKGVKRECVIACYHEEGLYFNLENLCEPYKSKTIEKLKYLYEKYVEPKEILKDVKEITLLIEKVKDHMSHTEDLEKEYYDNSREIRELQFQNLNAREEKFLESLVEKNSFLLKKIHYLKDKKNQDKINEIEENVVTSFGLKGREHGK